MSMCLCQGWWRIACHEECGENRRKTGIIDHFRTSTSDFIPIHGKSLSGVKILRLASQDEADKSFAQDDGEKRPSTRSAEIKLLRRSLTAAEGNEGFRPERLFSLPIEESKGACTVLPPARSTRLPPFPAVRS